MSSPTASEFIPGTVHLVDHDSTISSRHAGVLCLWKTLRLMSHFSSAAIYSILVPISDATDLTVAGLNPGTGYMFLAQGTTLWAPYAVANDRWIANKALCEVSNADVYFTPERGTYAGLYAFFPVSSNFLASVIAEFINDTQGWEWVLHWCAIFCGATLLSFYSSWRNQITIAQPLPLLLPPFPVTIGPMRRHSLAHQPPRTWRRTVKPKRMKFKLFRREDLQSKVPVTVTVLRPLLFFSFPFVMFSGFMCGSTVRLFNVLTSTASLTLSNEPYNFSASIVGLSYVLCLISPLGDKFILWQARRHNGIMEPEQRPWLYTALLLLPGSLLPWSVGAAHEVHWFGLVFAMGALTASLTIGCGLPIRYCIDCYKDLSADTIVPVILIRNTMVFAITPWVENLG
ncbi:hypothetical protein BDW71DRAFT_200341 [Aspergillus fruticulosus]